MSPFENPTINPCPKCKAELPVLCATKGPFCWYYWIKCNACNHEGPRVVNGTDAMAIEAWNHQTPGPVPESQHLTVKELAEFLTEMAEQNPEIADKEIAFAFDCHARYTVVGKPAYLYTTETQEPVFLFTQDDCEVPRKAEYRRGGVPGDSE